MALVLALLVGLLWWVGQLLLLLAWEPTLTAMPPVELASSHAAGSATVSPDYCALDDLLRSGHGG